MIKLRVNMYKIYSGKDIILHGSENKPKVL